MLAHQCFFIEQNRSRARVACDFRNRDFHQVLPFTGPPKGHQLPHGMVLTVEMSLLLTLAMSGKCKQTQVISRIDMK